VASNIAVGMLRPPHVFFYEVDCPKGKMRKTKMLLKFDAQQFFQAFSLYRTKHGYHLIGYPFSMVAWKFFKRFYKSDFTMKLKPRWNRRYPQVLRISEKFDLKTGKVVSPAPKLVCGNLFLDNIQKYKVMYFAK
jgi:hypothetical protein